MKMKKWLILFLPILMFSLLIYGWLFGFPSERHNLSIKVQEYVETKYGLTPTNIQISFSIDGMDTAFVSTEEEPFDFQVYIRRDSKKVSHDLYLESLIEHYLKKFAKEKIDSFIDYDNIRFVLEKRFSKTNPELTVEEVRDDPNILLGNPDITYFCSVDGVEVGSEISFLVFEQITKILNPTSIYFSRVDIDGEKKAACIKSNDFNKIKNKDDLRIFTTQ